MPRKPRYEEAGAIHHVYARGVNRRKLFENDFDRSTYLSTLAQVVRGWRWQCFTYCLMDNHVHLLVRTAEPNLGSGMQRLHSLYAQGFNERHGRLGHLFQGRYGSSRVRTAAQGRYLLGYIDANPVNAGMCAAPHDWPWGGCAARRSGRVPGWLCAEDLLEGLL